jgi:hypothetical protein
VAGVTRPRPAKAANADEAALRASKSRDKENAKSAAALDGLASGQQQAPAPKAEPSLGSAARRVAARAPSKKAVAQAAPAAKPRPGRVGKGKGDVGADAADILAAEEEGKAAHKGQLALKSKGLGPTAPQWVALGDKARDGGRCDYALGHYNRAVAIDAKLAGVVAARVRSCAAQLGEAGMAKAAKSNPHLAGLIRPELERVRRARAEQAAKQGESQVRGPRKAKAANKKPAATSTDAYMK